MSLTPPLAEIDYPESDGKPMGESDFHREWMIRIFELLRYRYQEQRVYIGSDLLVYYVEGDPRRFIVPDVFLVLDCERGRRRTFRTWEEGRSPDVVFEVTSHSTRREDGIFKPRKYGQIGVQELFLYDPTADYLEPPLQGIHFEDGEPIPMTTDSSGSLRCETLGLQLSLDDVRLVIADSRTGEELLTEAEAERAARTEAEARAEAEAAARRAAEEELQRLRDQLRQQGDPS